MLSIMKRCMSSITDSVPVITIPAYLKNQIKKIQAKQERKHMEGIRYRSRLGNRKVPIITSPQKPELNHYLGRMYDKRRELPLISLGWRNGKYRGHSFTIHKHADNPCVQDPRCASFSNLGLKPQILKLLNQNGFKTPSVIQERAIPVILLGGNAVCCAETGSGKTLAYVAPLLQLALQAKQAGKRPPMAPLVLVLTPTKELCLQVSDLFYTLGSNLGLNICSLIPGVNLQDSIGKAQDQAEVDVIVSTMGACNVLVEKDIFSVAHLDHVVIDEADSLLDNSFIDPLEQVLRYIIIRENNVPMAIVNEINGEVRNEERRRYGAQLVLVGATLPKRLEDGLGDLFDISTLHRVQTNYLHRLSPHLTHHFTRMGKEETAYNLVKLVKAELSCNHPLMVFFNRTETASWGHYYLKDNGVPNVCLHKGLDSKQRKDHLQAFHDGQVDVMVATDLGSRGLDTSRVKHVINFDFPRHMSDYIHRSGRTGRLRSDSPHGQVTSFVSSKHDVQLLQQIETAARQLKPLPDVDANIKGKYEDFAAYLEMKDTIKSS